MGNIVKEEKVKDAFNEDWTESGVNFFGGDEVREPSKSRRKSWKEEENSPNKSWKEEEENLDIEDHDFDLDQSMPGSLSPKDFSVHVSSSPSPILIPGSPSGSEPANHHSPERDSRMLDPNYCRSRSPQRIVSPAHSPKD